MQKTTERRAIVRMNFNDYVKEMIYPESLARTIYWHGCAAHGRAAMALIILND